MLINNIEFVIDTNHKILSLSEVDKAYIAGLIDGEGCFMLNKKQNCVAHTPSFQIRMTDKNIIYWLRNIIDLGTITTVITENKNWKDSHCLVLSYTRCLLLTSIVLPYLRVKKKQAEIIIEYSLIISGRKGRYNKYSEEEKERMKYLETEIRMLNKKGK